jgi:hypothetical protein
MDCATDRALVLSPMKTPAHRKTLPFPANDKRAKPGSNVRGKVLAAYHAKEQAEIRARLARHRKAYQLKAKKLLTKTELREATTTVKRLRHEYQASNLKLGSDAAKWEANKASYRNRVRQFFTRSLPKYREVMALAQAAREEFQKLLPAELHRVAPGVSLNLGDLPTFELTAQTFSPEFPLFDLWLEDYFHDARDHSAAYPSIGHVINNLHFEHDADTSVLNGIFGLYDVASVWSRVGCGFNYTVTATGRLRIVASLQNFYTRVSMSLEDNFGFSSGILYTAANLYVDLVRGSEITTLHQTVVEKIIKSDGDDNSATLPSIDDTAPLIFDVTTDETFQAGAALQIVAGSEFICDANLDDMKASVDALLWYRINSITVDVV